MFVFVCVCLCVCVCVCVCEEELLIVKKQRDILHEISKWKNNWFGHILHRNCLLQQVIEGRIKGGNISDRKTAKKT